MLVITAFETHPVYISVTTIEQNAKDKTLEITCKMFTDDLEKAVKGSSSIKLDLYKKTDKAKADELIKNYIGRHLILSTKLATLQLQYVGFEIQEESVLCYFQVNNIASLPQLEVSNNLLYETQKEQMGIIHVISNGKRKSFKLQNPDKIAAFYF